MPPARRIRSLALAAACGGIAACADGGRDGADAGLPGQPTDYPVGFHAPDPDLPTDLISRLPAGVGAEDLMMSQGCFYPRTSDGPPLVGPDGLTTAIYCIG